MSDIRTLLKIRQRNENKTHMTKEQLQAATKEIKKRVREDKRRWQRNLVRKEMTIKDKWAGIKLLKEDFKPRVYARKKMTLGVCAFRREGGSNGRISSRSPMVEHTTRQESVGCK